MRHPIAGGSGTNYWLTSDGGPDGRNSSTGYLRFGSGRWEPEGAPTWHHAFTVTGREVPEPTSLALLAVAGLAALRRRTTL